MGGERGSKEREGKGIFCLERTRVRDVQASFVLDKPPLRSSYSNESGPHDASTRLRQHLLSFCFSPRSLPFPFTYVANRSSLLPQIEHIRSSSPTSDSQIRIATQAAPFDPRRSQPLDGRACFGAHRWFRKGLYCK